ncbi:MAG: T9SS type A sorting domain-containing protein [Bacteroidota bacterium]|nr:T9SS type A sorting domain-containing protein [Bacteroidota bacterium]
MKKIYLIAGAVVVSASAFAQGGSFSGNVVANSAKNIPAKTAPSQRLATDTTGIGFNVITNVTFLPEFAPNNSVVNWGYLGGGYIFGNNVFGGLNICAQGYQNLNTMPVEVDGVILWFAGIENDMGSSATSKVVIKAYDMAPNKACNTNGAGTFNTTVLNDDGPTGAPKATADLLFSAIDTTFLADNYVPFSSPPSFAADFAIAVDFNTLAPGDTAGLYADQEDDAGELDYAFHFYSGKWHTTDHLFSDPAVATENGTGALNNDIAIFAVFGDATGVNEFFNGMKLTTYPNPASVNSKIEYTLEKDSRNVSITVFDQAGRKVLENKYDEQSAGSYKVDVETINLASGTYFYQLRANGNNFTKKLVVAK